MRCRICGHAELARLLEVGDLRHRTSERAFDVLRCGGCGCLVTARDGDFVDPSESYPQDYGAFLRKKPGGAKTLRRLRRSLQLAGRLRRLLRHSYIAADRLAWLPKLGLRKEARVLDVGCGTGEIGECLGRELGVEVTGVEPNLRAASIARERGLQVHVGTLASFEPGGSFDAAVLIHVLEHLEDPRDSLRRIHQWLRPQGLLVVALPNAGSLERLMFGRFWDGWDIPRHVHHFHPPSLRFLLQAASFEIFDFSYEWYSLLSRSLSNRLLWELPYRLRQGRYRFAPLEMMWGFFLSSLKRSSAVQVIAVKAEDDAEA